MTGSLMIDPWDIPRAQSQGNRTERLADPDHPLDFYRGRDFEGRYLFWLDCEAAGAPPVDLPRIGGVEIDLRQSTPERWFLGLALRDSNQLEIFRALCANLMTATASLARGDGERGVGIVLNRLKRWQDLLRRRDDDLLSRSEILGLVGELLFLRDRLIGSTGDVDAVLAWRGPYGDEQDFVVGGRIVEIKTQLATADRRFQISTEDQLDTTSGEIALCHQTLGLASSGTPEARSLNALVDELLERLLMGAGAAADIFRAGLIESGYRIRPEYDVEWWVPGDFRVYEVADEFPRLVASSLPSGVSRVRYEISAVACSPFEKPLEWLNGFLHHDRV